VVIRHRFERQSLRAPAAGVRARVFEIRRHGPALARPRIHIVGLNGAFGPAENEPRSRPRRNLGPDEQQLGGGIATSTPSTLSRRRDIVGDHQHSQNRVSCMTRATPFRAQVIVGATRANKGLADGWSK
jgi:hypothetical protein